MQIRVGSFINGSANFASRTLATPGTPYDDKRAAKKTAPKLELLLARRDIHIFDV